ncbi:hypothetical protein BJV78DRAFT_276393 [Lactifluus subvellereus]|nr:hypothetical protein BJV78DRAFT_276393 [Lactifluus subvellereus]
MVVRRWWSGTSKRFARNGPNIFWTGQGTGSVERERHQLLCGTMLYAHQHRPRVDTVPQEIDITTTWEMLNNRTPLHLQHKPSHQGLGMQHERGVHVCCAWEKISNSDDAMRCTGHGNLKQEHFRGLSLEGSTLDTCGWKFATQSPLYWGQKAICLQYSNQEPSKGAKVVSSRCKKIPLPPRRKL